MADYLKLLNQKKEDLEKSLETLVEAAKTVDLNEPIGGLSRMDAIQQQQMTLNNRKQLELNLQLVESALKRLEDDEHGYCLKCEDEINLKSLLERREAPFCTNCQN